VEVYGIRAGVRRTGMTHVHRLVAMIVFLAASAALADVASAGRSFHERFQVEDSFEFENLCDVDGLNVLEEWVAEVSFREVQRGRDRVSYFAEHYKERRVFTNLDNGKTVTGVTTANLKDLKVTDNGDGTLTILLFGTGTEVIYGADGKAIFRNPGQSRAELLFDHNGTPTDLSDDVFISDETVKGSTGRNDDFCETVVPALS
jgi:hypothetical protein